MPAVSATFGLDIQFGASSAAWTSASADVRSNEGVRISYGIQAGGPLDRIAPTGTMSFALDNSRYNSQSASGAYSPDHANLRSGFAIGNGVRGKFTYSGSTFYKFVGKLDSIEPLGGKYRGQSAQCEAVDWFDDAAKFKLRLIEVQTNKRADQNIATVIGTMTKKPAASTLATGQDVFPYSVDNSQDETTTVLAEIAKNVLSELGHCYIVGDTVTGGVLLFDDRHTRPKTTPVSASLANTMVEMRAGRANSTVFNRV